MTPSEIAELLINGNISDARREFGSVFDREAAVLALDVLANLIDCVSYSDVPALITDEIARLRRCLTGEP